MPKSSITSIGCYSMWRRVANNFFITTWILIYTLQDTSGYVVCVCGLKSTPNNSEEWNGRELEKEKSVSTSTLHLSIYINLIQCVFSTHCSFTVSATATVPLRVSASTVCCASPLFFAFISVFEYLRANTKKSTKAQQINMDLFRLCAWCRRCGTLCVSHAWHQL